LTSSSLHPSTRKRFANWRVCVSWSVTRTPCFSGRLELVKRTWLSPWVWKPFVTASVFTSSACRICRPSGTGASGKPHAQEDGPSAQVPTQFAAGRARWVRLLATRPVVSIHRRSPPQPPDYQLRRRCIRSRPSRSRVLRSARLRHAFCRRVGARLRGGGYVSQSEGAGRAGGPARR